MWVHARMHARTHACMHARTHAPCVGRPAPHGARDVVRKGIAHEALVNIWRIPISSEMCIDMSVYRALLPELNAPLWICSVRHRRRCRGRCRGSCSGTTHQVSGSHTTQKHHDSSQFIFSGSWAQRGPISHRFLNWFHRYCAPSPRTLVIKVCLHLLQVYTVLQMGLQTTQARLGNL